MNGYVLTEGPEYDALMEDEINADLHALGGLQNLWEQWRGLRDSAEPSSQATAADPEWLTVAEVAKRYRWSPKTVRKDIAAGRLLASQSAPGRPHRVRRSDAETWALARQAPQTRAPRKRRNTATRPPESAGGFRKLVRNP